MTKIRRSAALVLLASYQTTTTSSSAAPNVETKRDAATTTTEPPDVGMATKHPVYVLVDQLIAAGVVGGGGGSRSDPLSSRDVDSFDDDDPMGVAVATSPRCWHSAVALLHHHHHHTETTTTHHHPHADPSTAAADFCARLSEIQQKRLALEIAQCHLQDLGVSLYRNTVYENLCTAMATDGEALVPVCLQQLTEAGQHSYTHYITYVQILCTRQTQELFLRYQQRVRSDMAQSYQQLSGQSIAHVLDLTEKIKALSETVLPNLVHEWLPLALDDQLQDRLDDLLRGQATAQASFFHNLMDQLQQRDEESQDRYDDWTSYQSSLLLQQSRAMEHQRQTLEENKQSLEENRRYFQSLAGSVTETMERQRESWEENRQKMQTLSKSVAETVANLQPFLNLQFWMQAAAEGYTFLTLVLFAFTSGQVVRITTRGWDTQKRRRPRWFRSCLYALVGTEAVLELTLLAGVRYGLLSATDRIRCLHELRRWAIVVECATYVVGTITRWFPFSVAAGSLHTGRPHPAVVASESRDERERLRDERLRRREPRSPEERPWMVEVRRDFPSHFYKTNAPQQWIPHERPPPERRLPRYQPPISPQHDAVIAHSRGEEEHRRGEPVSSSSAVSYSYNGYPQDSDIPATASPYPNQPPPPASWLVPQSDGDTVHNKDGRRYGHRNSGSSRNSNENGGGIVVDRVAAAPSRRRRHHDLRRRHQAVPPLPTTTTDYYYYEEEEALHHVRKSPPSAMATRPCIITPPLQYGPPEETGVHLLFDHFQQEQQPQGAFQNDTIYPFDDTHSISDLPRQETECTEENPATNKGTAVHEPREFIPQRTSQQHHDAAARTGTESWTAVVNSRPNPPVVKRAATTPPSEGEPDSKRAAVAKAS